jgi:hypothetical protein
MVRVAAVLVLVSSCLCLGASPARADVPGAPRCDAEGKGCEACWREYQEKDSEQFVACRDAALQRGLKEACRHRQGAGDSVYYCPAGTEVKRTSSGGGCAGCATHAPSGDEPLAWLGVAGALAGLVARGRRARRRAARR